MLTKLLTVLIAALILYLIYFLVGKFMSGQPLKIVGIILGVVFLLYSLRAFNFISI